MSCSKCALFKRVFLANLVVQIMHLKGHMATHLPFLCKTCIANITIERLFLHELILVQEADKKFEPFNDHNAIGVKFWSFMFLCYILVQS